MKIPTSRAAGFAIIAAVYILAAAIGITIYIYLPLPFWMSLLIADVASTAAVFIFSLIFKNASVYDPYWSVQPLVILICFAVAGGALTAPRILLLVCVTLWGVRLTANWAYTFKNLTVQDWRYTMLAQTTGYMYPFINFIGIHLVPTLVVYGCILPAVFVMQSHAPLTYASLPFFALSVCATILQGAADIQMHIFRARGTGGFMREGLWKYSRHPNYLGEILMWWGVAFFSIFTLGGQWYLVWGAAANTLLFLCVSVPLADGKQSRKEGFDEYKKQTRMLLPIKKFTKK